MQAYTRTLWTLAILSMCCGVNPALAQSGSFRSVSVNLTTPGLTFTVDGVPYDTSQVFSWQVGDTHVIRVPKGETVGQLPALGGGNNAAIGIRTLYSGAYSITTDTGTPVPLNGFQDLTNVTDAEYVYRVTVWSFLSSIDFTTSRLYQMRFVTPSAGCAPTASGQNIPGGCGDVPGFTELRCSDGSTYAAVTGDFWCPAGETVLTAIPGVGYAFKDWNSNPGLPNSSTVGTAGSLLFNLDSPFHIQVNFGPGKLYRINTEPAGFDVFVDNSLVRTGQLPFDNREICSRYESMTTSGGAPVNIGQGGESPSTNFCTVWLVGGTRLLGAKELQLDPTGVPYVFDAWSFGGGQDALFSVSGDNLSTDTLTARFVRAGGVTFVSQPQLNLPLIVSGRTWPSYNFWFGLNKQVTFTAPAEATDATGRRWRFSGWSNGGPATQTLTITQEIVDKGIYLTAHYEPMNKLIIETDPAGIGVTVDGKFCPTPCYVEKLFNETVTIAPIPNVNQKNVLRLEFTNWTDGGPAERVVNFTPALRRLVASYKQLYLFTAVSNPPEGATFTLNPKAADNFYPLDSIVSVTVNELRGFKFRRWSSDASGTSPTTNVTIGGPRSAVANLERVPYIDPGSIKNAAGTGPQDSGELGRVAPGSLISITGVNLTPKEETGPRSPQAQTLAEVAVKAGERILPLSYASASLINAQLPYDLPLGPNKLTIVRVGQPEVSADFEIVRNAPGLFNIAGTESEGVPPFVLAFRTDGTTITEAKPAAPNEVINLIATGLGSYRSNPPAGFIVPAGAEFALLEPVEVIVNDQPVQPLKVIATPGYVGMTSVQVRLGAQFPVGQQLKVRLRVNGKDSNTARLLVR